MYLVIPPPVSFVGRVIDGDTIELIDGRRVRYIGIDTPETRRRVNRRWIDDPEPMGPQATQANRELVQGRFVRLEYDAERRDRYGRLLAYVFVDDTMINERLLAEGYGTVLIIPPDVKYEERLRQAEARAQEAKRGLWREVSTKRGG